MLKLYLSITISVLIILFLGGGCSSNGLSSVSSGSDTVTTATVKLADTTVFKKSNGVVCAIYSEASFCYPTSYVNKASVDSLQKLYIKIVLDAPDTLSLNDAMQACVSNSLHQYDMALLDDNLPADSEIDESVPVLNYKTSTTIQLHQNNRQLVTFCRIDVVKKDSIVTSVIHHYYTIDLKTMTQVGLPQLVRDDARSQLTAMLRSRLLEQNKVENNDQLNELGYFNIDNIAASGNFYFDENGVTWSYPPNKLAVSAIGEPRITLTYDELLPLACENSILERIK